MTGRRGAVSVRRGRAVVRAHKLSEGCSWRPLEVESNASVSESDHVSRRGLIVWRVRPITDRPWDRRGMDCPRQRRGGEGLARVRCWLWNAVASMGEAVVSTTGRCTKVWNMTRRSLGSPLLRGEPFTALIQDLSQYPKPLLHPRLGGSVGRAPNTGLANRAGAVQSEATREGAWSTTRRLELGSRCEASL